MEDNWYTFPATMGEDQAWITCNHGYAKVAQSDPRNQVLRIRLPFKDPTEYGMPTNEEFPDLSAVDESLDDRLTQEGGLYVGRVTVAGHRYFYFYVDFSEEKAAEIIEGVSITSSYKLEYHYETDRDKQFYWDELYPTEDDWQVIQDLRVLDALIDDGDIRDREREIMHWAYFPTEETCRDFASWVQAEDYEIHYQGKAEGGSDYLARYSHVGTTDLWDITSHTIKSNRKAREIGGRYDGWETSVERA